MPIEFTSDSVIGGNGTAGLTLSGALSGAGGLEIRSNFTLTFSGPDANSYHGTTNLNAGNLVLNKSADRVTALPGNLVIGDGSADVSVTIRAHSEQIADNSDVTINNRGTLKLDASGPQLTEKVGTLSGNGIVDLGAFQVTGAHNTLMTDGKDGAMFSGKITGSGNLVKYGDHNLVLAGKSDYTGTTTVQGGILTIDGSIGTKNTPTEFFRVDAGTLKGTGTISTIKGEAKNFTVGPGAKIHPGNSPGILTIDSGGFGMEAGSVSRKRSAVAKWAKGAAITAGSMSSTASP
jgi:fibronectin-binding autotransporter adhesin